MARPQVLVEALASRNDSGLGRLVRMSVDALRGLAKVADIHVILPASGFYQPGTHCRTIKVTPEPMRLWTQTAFPILIRKIQPNLVLCLGQTLPRLRPKSKYALLIPDVGPLENLGLDTSSHDHYNRKWLNVVPHRADLLITCAEFTKNRIIQILKMPKDRVRVIRPIHASYFPRTVEPRVCAVVPDGKYFLTVGNVEPRKNFPGLITAYEQLKQRRPNAPPLIITGNLAWGFQEAQKAVATLGLTDSVIFTGHVSEKDLQSLVANCTVFVSSSLYEGWGFPLFEALALGKPAIYHRGSSQEEFARGMAMSVDCGYPGELAQAMENLWHSALLRETLMTALRSGFDKVLDYDMEAELRDALEPLLEG